MNLFNIIINFKGLIKVNINFQLLEIGILMLNKIWFYKLKKMKIIQRTFNKI